jgi:hypothetical protein
MLHTLRFSLQNAVYFIMLTFLVHVLFTFYIQSVLKFKLLSNKLRFNVTLVSHVNVHYQPTTQLDIPNLLSSFYFVLTLYLFYTSYLTAIVADITIT